MQAKWAGPLNKEAKMIHTINIVEEILVSTN